MDVDMPEGSTEGASQPDTSPVAYAAASASEAPKRRARDDWAAGHHHSKSTRFDYATVAPQQPTSGSESEDQHAAEALASQRNLFNALNGILLANLVNTFVPGISSLIHVVSGH